MATGVLGLAGGGSASLNQNVIDKLKAAESKATVEPINTDIKNWETESAKMLEIKALNISLIASFKALSLDNTTNAFEQKSATTSGTSVNYDVTDVSTLIEGTTNISITQLAQKDVYQTSTFTDSTALIAGGQDSGDMISISTGGTQYDFSTVGQNYDDLAATINLNADLNASVEQVGDSSYRLVIKSANSGISNALTLTQTGVSLGINSQLSSAKIADTAVQVVGGNDSGDGITIDGTFFTTEGTSYIGLKNSINADANFNASIDSNNKLVITRVDGADLNITETGVSLGFSNAIVNAQNLKATVDGVAYDVSSNSITTQGSLKITANELGNSSITIRQDTSSVLSSVNEMVTQYNSMMSLLDGELQNPSSTIKDKSSLRLMQSTIKNSIFANYGANSDKNIFNFGFSLDKAGLISLDEGKFNTAVSTDLDSLKALLIGTPENKGLGTVLNTYTDGLDGYNGLLSLYDTSLTDRKSKLDENLTKETDSLDAKYKLMAENFASYGSLIATMEAQFSSLKMMINQSVSSN